MFIQLRRNCGSSTILLMKLLLAQLAAILTVLSTGCIVRETVTEHGEVASDRLEVHPLPPTFDTCHPAGGFSQSARS
jgi:hypothetical protein